MGQFFLLVKGFLLPLSADASGLAGAAVPLPRRRDIQIITRVRVALLTVSTSGLSSLCVLGVCHHLKMAWVVARSVVAEVVNLQSVWNGAIGFFVN